MKVVIPGGTRQVGAILNRAFAAVGHEVVVLTRWPSPDGHVAWDGETMGAWAGVIDGVPVGLPATRWMAELGALAIRSDTELLLKSRRVIPGPPARRRLRVQLQRVGASRRRPCTARTHLMRERSSGNGD